jgi:hypothetical protein
MEQPQLERNPGNETPSYADAVRKGQKLIDMMQAEDHTAGQMFDPPRVSAESQFLEQQCLRDWGYTRSYTSWISYAPSSFDAFFEALGMNPSESATEILDRHNRLSSIHGAMASATDAEFKNVMDYENGLLIAWANHSPDYLVGSSGGAVPELKHWSDMAYLQWCDPKVSRCENSELKYVLRHEIQNKGTLAIMRRIEDEYRRVNGMEDGWKPVWPGITLEADSAESKALLGTPNGHGVAWLLIQHKRQLGHMAVGKITVFLCDPTEPGCRSSSLLFHLNKIQS